MQEVFLGEVSRTLTVSGDRTGDAAEKYLADRYTFVSQEKVLKSHIF